MGFLCLGFNTKWYGSISSDTICCAWMRYDHDCSILLTRSGLSFRYDQIRLDRIARSGARWGADLMRPSRSMFLIWDDVARTYTFWCVHLELICSVVTGYDCGPDGFHDPHQGYPRFELRLDPKGIYTARLTIDCIMYFKMYD